MKKNETENIETKNPDIKAIEESLIKKFGEKNYKEARERAKFKLDLAQAVKRRRIEMHMDQKELARKLHTTQQQLSRYEIGENSPTIERLYDICKMLDLDIVIMDNKNGKELIRA